MDISRDFGSSLGFFQTSNIRKDNTHGTYQWFPKHSVVQSFGLEVNDQVAWDHAGNRVLHYSTWDPFVLLPRNIVIAPLGGQNSDTVGPQNGYAIDHNINFTENQIGFVTRGQPWSAFNFNMTCFPSVGNVNYNPLAGKAPTLLRQNFLQLLFTVQPFRQLTADQTYLLDHDRDDHTGVFVYQSEVMRTKINYQFTRSLSARVIVEYDSTLANRSDDDAQANEAGADPGAADMATASGDGDLCGVEQRFAELQSHAVLAHGWDVRSDAANFAARAGVFE